MQDINNSGDFDCTCTHITQSYTLLRRATYMHMYAIISVKRQSTGVYTPNKLAMILKLDQAFSYTLKMRSPGGMFSQIKVIVGN